MEISEFPHFVPSFLSPFGDSCAMAVALFLLHVNLAPP
jgi:hypothetical protein